MREVLLFIHIIIMNVCLCICLFKTFESEHKKLNFEVYLAFVIKYDYFGYKIDLMTCRN